MSDLPDRLAIRELLEAYGDAVVRGDAFDWGRCWAEDGVWTLMGTRVEGRAGIVALWTQAMAGFAAVSFLSQPGPVAIDGNRATCRTQTHEVMREIGGRCRVVGGLYDDAFVRHEGRWLFAAREYRVVAEYPGETV